MTNKPRYISDKMYIRSALDAADHKLHEAAEDATSRIYMLPDYVYKDHASNVLGYIRALKCIVSDLEQDIYDAEAEVNRALGEIEEADENDEFKDNVDVFFEEVL